MRTNLTPASVSGALLSVLSVFVLGINFGANAAVGGLTWQYLFILASLPVLLGLVLGRIRRDPTLNVVYARWLVIPVLMLFLWGYGVLSGLLQNNNPQFIVRNNAGMIAYALAIPLFFFPRRVNVIKLLNAGGLLVMGATLLLHVLSKLIGWDVESGLSERIFGPTVGAGGYRWGRIFFYTQYLVCVPMVLSLTALLSKGFGLWQRAISLATLAGSLYVLMVISMSKGMVLAVLFTLALLVTCFFFAGRRRGLITSALVPLLLFGGVSYVAATPDNVISRSFFSADDLSNGPRFEQVRYLVGDTTILGQGLGATIPGYTRAKGLDYGFELSYLAVFHKFGVFGLIPLLAYALTLLMIIRLVWQRRLSVRDGAALGAGMSFLMPAVGNPGLFSIQEVLTHSLVMLHLANAQLGVAPAAARVMRWQGRRWRIVGPTLPRVRLRWR
ncbi:hypothetical protein Dxin01_02777 [Deinococcus xinjiangensis]|uniref:O-antigen ligase n=1 Tax=Deinococcus xinjiangensis TaxID=457454 RepID=A0ABP9VG32_9DEIO